MSETETIVTRLTLDEGSVAHVQDRIARAGEKIGSTLESAFHLYLFKEVGEKLLGMAEGIVKVNSEAQNAKVGIAGMFAAMSGKTVDQTMSAASGVIQQLTADAAKGAGELQDYVQAYQQLLAPVVAAGGSAADVEKLTKLGIGAGFAMRGEMGMKGAPLDIIQGLAGGMSASESQVLAPLLGMAGHSIKELNAAKPAEKLKMITAAFEKMAPAVEAAGKTWDAQVSTLRDNMVQLIRAGSSEMFGDWTAALIRVNDWLARVKNSAMDVATSFGETFANLSKSITENPGGTAAVGAAGAAVVTIGTLGFPELAAAGLLVLPVIGAVEASLAESTDLWWGLKDAVDMSIATFGPLMDAFNSLTESFGVFSPWVDAFVYELTLAVDTFTVFLKLFTMMVNFVSDSVNTMSSVLGLVAKGEFLAATSLYENAAIASAGRVAAGFADIADFVRGTGAYADQKKFDEYGPFLNDFQLSQLKKPPAPVINIGKIEIKVDQVDDPNQVATSFRKIEEQLRKYPTSPSQFAFSIPGT